MASLIFKWLKSENTSSPESRELATKTRKAFGMTSRDYRRALTDGRKYIDNWSLSLDIKILCKTVVTVFKEGGR